jgi:hypothetical protein
LPATPDQHPSLRRGRPTAPEVYRARLRAIVIDRPRVQVATLLLAATVLACGQAIPSATPAGQATVAPTASETLPAGTVLTTLEPEPTVTDTGSAGTPPCLLADLKASHGLIEGAAGSRLTEVVLVSASTCSVDAFPALRLRDSTGAGLIGAVSAGPGAVDLVPGVAYMSDVRVSNWCLPQPSFPLSLVVVLGEDELPVTGDSFPEDGDLPPCNGDGGATLDATGWAPGA